MLSSLTIICGVQQPAIALYRDIDLIIFVKATACIHIAFILNQMKQSRTIQELDQLGCTPDSCWNIKFEVKNKKSA